jgi:integrase
MACKGSGVRIPVPPQMLFLIQRYFPWIDWSDVGSVSSLSATTSATDCQGGQVPGQRANGEGSIYQRTSDKRWLGAVTIGVDSSGRPKRKIVSAKSRAETLKKLRALQRQIDDGLPAPDTRLTVGQLLDRWLDDVNRHQVTISTANNYRAMAEHHIKPALGKKKVASLTTSDVDRFLSKKTDDGLSVSTVRRIRNVLSQALDQGIRWDLVVRNVTKLSRSPRGVRQEGRSLSPEQAKQLLNTLRGHRNEALYALMLSIGLRRGEALGLQWRDFDDQDGVLLVRRSLTRESGQLVTKDTKTLKSRRAINVPSPLRTLLKSHRADQNAERLKLGKAWTNSGHIFTTSIGTPIDPRNMYREFREVCRDAGIGDWHPHELRHSAASLMLAQGVKIQVVSEVLGHSSIRMTADVYGHVLAPDRQAAADAMGTLLWDIRN